MESLIRKDIYTKLFTKYLKLMLPYTDKTRPHLNGVYLQDGEGSNMNIFAADGFCGVRVIIETTIELSQTIFLPTPLVQLLTRSDSHLWDIQITSTTDLMFEDYIISAKNTNLEKFSASYFNFFDLECCKPVSIPLIEVYSRLLELKINPRGIMEYISLDFKEKDLLNGIEVGVEGGTIAIDGCKLLVFLKRAMATVDKNAIINISHNQTSMLKLEFNNIEFYLMGIHRKSNN